MSTIGRCESTVRQKRPGYWDIRVDAGRDPVTKGRPQVSRGFRGRRSRQRRRRGISPRRRTPVVTRGTKGSVTGLLEEWYDHEVGNWSATDAARVRSIIGHHQNPALGTTPLSRLEASGLHALCRRLVRRNGLSHATVRKVCTTTIRRALSQGVKWKWLAVNPATAATPPRVDRPEIRPPSPPT